MQNTWYLLKASGAYVFRPNGTFSIKSESQVSFDQIPHQSVMILYYWFIILVEKQGMRENDLFCADSVNCFAGSLIGWSTPAAEFMDIAGDSPIKNTFDAITCMVVSLKSFSKMKKHIVLLLACDNYFS